MPKRLKWQSPFKWFGMLRNNPVINASINNVIIMARRPLDQRHIRSLTKTSAGKSYSVTIPIEYIKKLKWKAKQKLEVTIYRDRIIIKDWKG